MLANGYATKQTLSYAVEKNVMDAIFPDSNMQISVKNFCPIIIFLQIYPKEIIRYRQRFMYRSVDYALFIKVKNWAQTGEYKEEVKFIMASTGYIMEYKQYKRARKSHVS